jgi:hypothetical protein
MEDETHPSPLASPPTDQVLDNVLETVLQFLDAALDRSAASLVCRSWHRVESATHHSVAVRNIPVTSAGVESSLSSAVLHRRAAGPYPPRRPLPSPRARAASCRICPVLRRRFGTTVPSSRRDAPSARRNHHHGCLLDVLRQRSLSSGRR